MADADPAMLAQMLDTGPDSSGVMPYLGGVLKGALWDPVKGAWSLAKRYGSNAAASIENPSQADPFLPFHDLQAAGSGLQDKLADTFGNGTDHFWDTAAGAAHSLKAGLTSSDPSTAGETLGAFLGPGDLAKGVGMLGEAPKLEMWGGAKAATHDVDSAQLAQSLKASGKSDASIWDQTGYYNPPENQAQAQPWHWIDDSKGKLQPGAVDKLKEAQALDAFPDGNGPPKITLGDVMHPDWEAFHAYPGLRDLPVRYEAIAPDGAVGSYRHAEGAIVLHHGALADAGDLRGTLVHEAAHAVQHFEQMPAGGSSDAMVHYGRGLEAALDDDNMAGFDLEHRQAVRDLAGRFREATTTGPEGRSLSMNGYYNLAGEANARLAEHMLNAPAPGAVLHGAGGKFTVGEHGLRPFEQYGLVGAMDDPAKHLVTGEGNLLMDPRLPPDGGLGQFAVTGNYRPSGPDLAKALKKLSAENR